MSSSLDELKNARRRKGSLLQTAGAVFWSFFGVRKRGNLDEDFASLNPIHVVIVGVAGAALFVVGLILLVQFIIGS